MANLNDVIDGKPLKTLLQERGLSTIASLISDEMLLGQIQAVFYTALICSTSHEEGSQIYETFWELNDSILTQEQFSYISAPIIMYYYIIGNWFTDKEVLMAKKGPTDYKDPDIIRDALLYSSLVFKAHSPTEALILFQKQIEGDYNEKGLVPRDIIVDAYCDFEAHFGFEAVDEVIKRFKLTE